MSIALLTLSAVFQADHHLPAGELNGYTQIGDILGSAGITPALAGPAVRWFMVIPLPR